MATSRSTTAAAVVSSDLSIEDLSLGPETAISVAPIPPRQEVVLTTSEDNFLKKLIDSKKLPIHVKSIEDAFTIGKMGKELGFPIMSSFHNIIPIQGKLTLTAKAQNALMRKAGITAQCIEDALYVYRDGSTSKYPRAAPVGGVLDNADKPVDQRTSIKFTRDGISEIVEFTWIDAVSQGLSEKDNWKRMKKDMMYARCMSRGATRIASDITCGLYSTDEMYDALGNSSMQVSRDEDGTINNIITPHEVVSSSTVA